MSSHFEQEQLRSSPDKGRLGGVVAPEKTTPSNSPLSGGELSAANKHPAAWNESRHTLGMGEMDNTHREFITQVAALIAASNAEFPALFQALINHTREHFIAEGKLMRESKYRGLPEHEGEHHRVLGELQQLNRSLKRGRLPLVRAYVKEGLPEWFDTHLSMMDGALVMFLKRR
ncbi:MAG: hemerythrin [Gallionellaceae bacterium]|nr:MAG: hemerythrin [Gallionellaceae bacterium]